MELILRPTKGIDLICSEPENLYTALNRLAEESNRKGNRKGKMEVHVGRAGTRIVYENVPVNLSYIGKEASSGLGILYEDTLKNAQQVKLSRGKQNAYPIVTSPEHLVAAKITAEANKEKHITDATNVIRVLKAHRCAFDDENVKSALKAMGKPEKIESLTNILYSIS